MLIIRIIPLIVSPCLLAGGWCYLNVCFFNINIEVIPDSSTMGDPCTCGQSWHGTKNDFVIKNLVPNHCKLLNL